MRCAEARSLRQLLCWLINGVSDAPTLRGVAHGCLNVGKMCHDKLKMLDLAEELFRRGRLVCDRLPSDEVEPQAAGEYTVQSLRARACNYLGILYIESGRAEEARRVSCGRGMP